MFSLEELKMKNVYPIFLSKTDTVVLVEVPDLEILTEGKDLQDAINMARDAIGAKCISMEDCNEQIPAPSEISELDISKGVFAEEGETILSLVDIDTDVYRKKTDTTLVRRNVSLPSWLNYEAEKAGLNVSRVLQEALISTLNFSKF